VSHKLVHTGLFLALLLAGCAGEKAASKRDLDRLHEELRQLQLAVARSESRLSALERQMALLAQRETVEGGSRASAYVLPEELEVVRLAPAAPEPPAVVEEDEDSYAFISIGGGDFDQPAPRALGADRAPPLPTHTPLREDLGHQREFEAAQALLDAGRLDEGIARLEAFLAAHPRDLFADNALLALGEAWLSRGDARRALEAFEGVIARYPAGDAVPMALLRQGDAHLALGDRRRARAAFQRLLDEFPGSRPSAIARTKLPLLDDGDS